MSLRLSRRNFEKLVDQALRDIPEPFAGYLRNVSVEVEPMPDRETCESVGVEDPRELLGFYHGTPLTERGLEQDLALPDRISIYQRNIEDACDSEEEIIDEVRTTVLHEVGHHFGLSEDDLTELGYE